MNKSTGAAWKKPAAAAARRRRIALDQTRELPNGFDRERAIQTILDRLKRYSDVAALAPKHDVVEAANAAHSTKPSEKKDK